MIAFARLLLRAPSVVLLDEPAVQLEPLAADRLREALRELLVGRTAIIIAHADHGLRPTDRRVVLQRGRVVQATGAADGR